MDPIRRIEQMMPGETVIHSVPIHWKNYIFPGLVLTLATAAGLYLAPKAAANLNEEPYMAVIVIAVLAVLIVTGVASASAILNLMYSRYIVTNRRIMKTNGFLATSSSEMSIHKCETVLMTQSIVQRLFRTGDLLVVTAGTTMYMKDVKDIVRFRQFIMDRITSEMFDADSFRDHLISSGK